MLVTERPGNLRVVSAEGKVGPPLSGVPVVWAQGQGGLLDVVLSPSSPRTARYTSPMPSKAPTARPVPRSVVGSCPGSRPVGAFHGDLPPAAEAL